MMDDTNSRNRRANSVVNIDDFRPRAAANTCADHSDTGTEEIDPQLSPRETLEVVKTYHKIRNPEFRRQALQVMQDLARRSGGMA